MPKEINKLTVAAILQTVVFFCNADDRNAVFVKWSYDGRRYVTPVEDRMFHAYLSEEYRKRAGTEGGICVKTALQPYIDKTILNGPWEPIYLRTAGEADYIEYFFADSDNQRIILTPNGGEITDEGKYNFLKPVSMKEQVLPDEDGDIQVLDGYVNLDKDDLLLFKIHLVQFFMNYSTHMAMVLNSSKGTGKSTLSRVIRELVDPSVVEICATPKTQKDLENLLSNATLCILDNTRVFNEDISNLLAGAITGTTLSSRKLYTNSDQVLVQIKTALILNGIDIISPKSDLCERSLCYSLKKIPAEQRRTDQEFWDSFQKDKPVILGGIFKLIVGAMKMRQEMKLDKHHRMADAFEDMAAISLAMGLELEEFYRIFDQNVARLQKRFAEANPVVEAIYTYMAANGTSQINGPAQQVYNQLKGSTYGRMNGFPKSPSAFSRFLNQEEDMLEAADLKFTRKLKHDYTNIKIWKAKK